MKFNDMKKSEENRERISSSDSDDSDNEIIVKTLFPVDKAVSVVESPNNSDLQEDYQGSADINTSDKRDGDEVIEKVARRRMEFPCSSQCKMSPKSSSLNSTTNLQGNCSHQESNNSKTKASHQELLDEKKSNSKDESAGKVTSPSTNKTSCNLS